VVADSKEMKQRKVNNAVFGVCYRFRSKRNRERKPMMIKVSPGVSQGRRKE